MASTNTPTAPLSSDEKQSSGFLAFLRRLMGEQPSASPAATDVGSPAQTSVQPQIVIGGYHIRARDDQGVPAPVGEILPDIRDGLAQLPPLPNVVIELLQEIQDSNSTAASVGKIACTDPALAASILRMVNGAAFGLMRKITSVSEAISYLGFAVLKSLVLRLRLDQMLKARTPEAMEDAEDLWVHALAVSYVADALAERVSNVDRGFVSTLGLLHDIGKLAIHSQFPDKAAALRAEAARNPDEGILARETRLLGADHAVLGRGSDFSGRCRPTSRRPFAGIIRLKKLLSRAIRRRCGAACIWCRSPTSSSNSAMPMARIWRSTPSAMKRLWRLASRRRW